MKLQQSQFIEFRATGQSYTTISKQLNVSKPTLIKWSRELANEIKNAKALELERIREEYLLSRQKRLQIMGAQLNQLSKEILQRDLSEVPTWRLYEMQRKVIVEVDKDTGEIEFIQQTRKEVQDTIKELFIKTEKWTG